MFQFSREKKRFAVYIFSGSEYVDYFNFFHS